MDVTNNPMCPYTMFAVLILPEIIGAVCHLQICKIIRPEFTRQNKILGQLSDLSFNKLLFI